MSALLELAERCEKATGPDDDLDVEISVAMGGKGDLPKIDMDRLARRRGEGASYSTLAAEFGVNQASIGKALKRLRARATQGDK